VVGSFTVPQASFNAQHYNFTSALEASLASISGLEDSEVQFGQLSFPSANWLYFNFTITLSLGQSPLLHKYLYSVTQEAIDQVTGGPYDQSTVTIDASLSCWVRKCAQVSAKLESGSPFTAFNDSPAVFHDQMALALDAELVDWSEVEIQSLMAVPSVQPDTLQVALAVQYGVEQTKAAQANGRIGRALSDALESMASVSADASLFELAFTITPCLVA
jgi:hypothetical protein